MFKQRPVLWVIGKSIFRIWHDLNFTFIKNIVKNQWLWDCCIFRSHTTSVSGEKAALVITCLPIFLFHNKCWVEFVVGWQFYKLNFLQMRGESNSDLTLLHCLCHNQLGSVASGIPSVLHITEPVPASCSTRAPVPSPNGMMDYWKLRGYQQGI